MTRIQPTNTSSIKFQGNGNFLAKQGFANFAESMGGAIIFTTVLRAASRPAFIYADKTAEPEAKKYSAAKELLYQLLCLCITIAILPSFKKGGFAIAKKAFAEKNPKIKDIFEDIESKKPYFTDKKPDEVEKLKGFKRFLDRFKNEKPHSNETQLIKGSIELGSLVGSILGLTILAPQIGNLTLHPIMKAIGLKKEEKPQVNTEAASQPIGPKTNSVNVQA